MTKQKRNDKLLLDDNLVLICYENLLTIFNIVNLF